ncbi:protein of unknown function [Selenomonas ruminantium]|uniref:DUF362 domain-containing protein n=1 Tax=Selenomonas ruminantium TaxID=971 RepID=A0A1M6XN48_SELRU|nr:DUF362 domain-containing protein [Selenomonas ruminantium]SHL07289.1 protein of unknown function [Selenomonas ruminantium]
MEKIALAKMEKATYERSQVESGVQEAFRLMGYDAENFGTGGWNPLGGIIRAGDKVLIKPNLVMHSNGNSQGGLECLFTQASVVEAVLRYVVRALLPDGGHVVIADAPMQACDFDKLVKDSGYLSMVEDFQQRFPQIQFELKDLRGVKSVWKNGFYRYYDNPNAEQKVVRLDKDSEFAGLPPERIDAMRITCYDPDILRSHHNIERHEYAVAQDILDADVIINMPKPKTHAKAGITCALKNLVGMSVRKEYLPHHTNGEYTEESSTQGGDAYKSRTLFRRVEDFLLDWKNRCAQTYHWPHIAWLLQQCVRVDHFLARFFCHEQFSEGSWYGNHTISKTIADLNKIAFYADKDGNMLPVGHKKARRYLIIADMVIAGDGEGPLAPSPNSVGIIGVGENPVAFDEVVATLYGAKMEYMHTINQARSTSYGKYPLIRAEEEGQILSNNDAWNGKNWREIQPKDKLSITPTKGWKKAFYS